MKKTVQKPRVHIPFISILTIFSRTSNLFGLLVDFECSNIDSTLVI